ncbi:MAG: glycosyltransferase [Lachnospiraceae bacterium]|nr:glycosyltransferase [Lachnospiraceae bacterium]
MKKLLVYSWGGFTDSQLLGVLGKLKIDYVNYSRKLVDYHKDMEAAGEIISLIHREKPGAIFSYNYIPLLSMIAQMNSMPYISWVYDCPHYTLFSETVTNEWNYIFCFDAALTEELVTRGVRHVFHFPLGVDVQDMENRIAGGAVKGAGKKSRSANVSYGCDVAFVGSFYNNEQNRLRHASFSEHTRGYLDGIIESQALVYGAHFIPQILPEKVLRELVEVCQLQLGDSYQYRDGELAAGIIDKEITARERERVLTAVAGKHQLHVYTGSVIPDVVSGQPGFVYKGFADPVTQMPVIFQQSKINLNISLKSITTGIPQRVLDILACGGFCLTNYQPEIAAYFEDGRELVMYSSIPDLCGKINYYLTHEEERQRIAVSGKEKVKQVFELELRVRKMLEMVEEV